MKSILITFALLITGVLSAQQMELDGKVYGSITSRMYKEAKLSNEVSPQIFHELTLKYNGYRIFFAKNSHFIQCMQSYGNAVGWELTPEEERNLRNYIKRNGGRMPKYKPEPVREAPIIKETEVLAAVDTVISKDSSIEEVSSVVLDIDDEVRNVVDTLSFEEISKPDTSKKELTPRNAVTLAHSEVVPLNRREVRVTPPMKYQGGQLTMNGERITARDAKYISRAHAPLAFKQFKRAASIRSWNYVWGLYSISTMASGVGNGDGFVTAVGVGIGGFAAVREKMRVEALEKGVYEYNKTLPGNH